MSAYRESPRVTAVLGPTNTGKTYLAIERMLDHDSGMIGFPLRLLARENYDRVVRLKGARRTALITGEEKIVPPSARYFVCTAESMPLGRETAFLAVDEIQMCADPERGHVFTDRLLRARGLDETMFLGADTMRPLLRRLVPEAEFVARPRLSRLSYTGPKKITRLPRRSAVVAFSASAVYEIAELIRRQRGGAAVVLGALSPRTRNAQVAMYQAGEVDYLVATDAIGMGLNMDVDHVAFWALAKFDGHNRRRLNTAEIAQIAGRAGRYLSDGTFGTVAELGPLAPDLVEAVENHRFDPVEAAQWRSADLRFASPKALIASLAAPSPQPGLVRAREAGDQRALAVLARDPEVVALARHPEAVRLLWDVCQIPDFRKTMHEAHTRLLGRIYRFLAGPEGRLPTDWVADQIVRLDRVAGDIDTLMARIAHVRTWTYVSHQAEWIGDAAHWQERARAVEDQLSDALHQRLTQRFVDRRAAALNRIKDKQHLAATVSADGEIVVEGEYVGRIEGFRFVPDRADSSEERRALTTAANRVLRREIAFRVGRLAAEPDEAFALEDDATVSWLGARVGRLRAGPAALSPLLAVTAADALTTEQRECVRGRLARWLARRLADDLGPLTDLAQAALSGPARGLAFQLAEGLGSLPLVAVRGLVAQLSAQARRELRGFGVRFGRESIYLPALLKPRQARLRALLWSIHQGLAVHQPPPPGLNTVIPEAGIAGAFYDACGYRIVGGRALRIDILDRLAIRLDHAARKGAFAISPEMLSLLGLSFEDAEPVVSALGYRRRADQGGVRFVRQRRANGKSGPRKPAATGGKRRDRKDGDDRHSPFAKLRQLRPSG